MSRARERADGNAPTGSVEGTDIAFLENSSGQDLVGGTYSTERMYLAGRTGSAPNDYNYKLTGDVNVTGHLALGSVADEDIVITQDGTERTITGSGTLDAGNVLQDTHTTSVTGMTGELGSAVTGSPAITGFGTVTSGTLGSGVTYPAGHIVKQSVNVSANSGHVTASSSNFTDTGIEVAHTALLSSTDSYIQIDWYSGMMEYAAISGTEVKGDITMRAVSDSTYTVADSLCDGSHPSYIYHTSANFYMPWSMKFFAGLETGMAVPASKTTWSAGDTLYFRLFSKISSGTCRFVHTGSMYSLTAQEVKR